VGKQIFTHTTKLQNDLINRLPGNLAYRGYRLFWQVLDWLYPPNCGGCGQPGTRPCQDCCLSTVLVEPPLCPICGNPNITDKPCSRCQISRPLFTSMRSHAIYQGALREAIHQLKYGQDMGMGEVLAAMMISSLKKLNWSLDIITSVPLGLVRFEERGYNQATLLARPIALSQRIPFSQRIITRIRETQTQVGLTLQERQENMDGAFRADRKLADGKNILVVDDVATSGATLNACAKALREAGAANIYGFSLARAVFQPNHDINIS
jgi:competence protein ComFC